MQKAADLADISVIFFFSAGILDEYSLLYLANHILHDKVTIIHSQTVFHRPSLEGIPQITWQPAGIEGIDMLLSKPINRF